MDWIYFQEKISASWVCNIRNFNYLTYQWVGCVLFLFARYIENQYDFFSFSLIPKLAQSILLIYYNGNIIKPMSIMEISGALGATFGPFIGSTLNYFFGYEGPFVVFSILYIQIFSFIVTYIPADNSYVMDKRETLQDGFESPKKLGEINDFQDSKSKQQMVGQSQLIELHSGLSFTNEDNKFHEKFCVTDPEIQESYGKLNEENNDYYGFHPFYDDLPKFKLLQLNRIDQSNHLYLKALENIGTSFKQSSKNENRIKPTQIYILLKNVQVFATIFTFFVSTCLWVYIEPLLSLYLVNQYALASYTTPIFFLVFSAGYLTATFSLIKYNRLKSISSKYQSVMAFILAGLSQVLISPIIQSLNTIWLTSLGLFLFGFFTTFTLVPIYNDMLRSLEKHFDLNRMSFSQVIDQCSSLTVFLKSVAQVIAPICGTYLYEWYGFSDVCQIFCIISIAYGIFLFIVL
ncbi:permeases of the major facilitator superfamily [Stylonychia lemnae]|uniref:Permeases of the major facilitator superfamily n=1 Tax=Stylonychia lemnae TaxID=5949 RepID=A0A078AN88_STYLE|nr:permeases of the major facilitator superfamily [Stylonychia lemnae]|eukprot:CDW83835.1 permeases of the major facilitator superfamily [Stylonychia lemnae]